MKPPHDIDAERSVLACMLISPTAADEVERIVDAADFYRPAHAHVFDAIRGIRADGDWPATGLVLDKLRASGMTDETMVDAVLDIAAATPPTSAAARFATIVAEHSARRKLIAAAADLANAAQLGDPVDVLDAHLDALEAIEVPGVRVQGLMNLDDLLDREDDQRSPWVVPGLLRRDWRVIVVAPEGLGKTQMLHQVALCASEGVHPFSLKTGHRPVRTLIVDAENPDERIQEGCRPIREAVRRLAGGWSKRTELWHRPGGLDLRSRRHRAELEQVLADTRPELVVAGPAYKLAHRAKGEDWDSVAGAVQAVLDTLRTRYQFALLMEDHAPQASGGVRELRPFGSSMWLRWPELGLKLIPKGDGDVEVGHWRGARLKHAWPDELHRGGAGSLSWVGYWRDGMEF